MAWTWFFRLGSPKWFYQMSLKWQPWLWFFAGSGLGIGLIWGLWIAPPDYYQGELQRIMYIHVPAAYLSMFVYVVMAVSGAIGIIWRMKMAYTVSMSCSPIGAAFTFLALTTGSLWGKPTWGTYWVFDARLTAELVLLFLYFGHMALFNAISDLKSADKAAAILAIVGVVNIPIIHFSVEWWNSLHQPASLSKLEKPSIDSSMLWPLLIMIVSFKVFFVAVLLPFIRNHILWRDRDAQWVKQEVESK
ncbi:MAG: heme ABC transporter permease [Gammaproteobacteria bacterium]|nr:heme ABC transporter permease [Gammaproteobacteria bacterium]